MFPFSTSNNANSFGSPSASQLSESPQKFMRVPENPPGTVMVAPIPNNYSMPVKKSYFGMPMPAPRITGPQLQLDNLTDRDCVAHLLEEVDKRVLVQLRDGRNLIGVLRSVDQFANLTLTQAVERIHVGKEFGDTKLGVIMVRGDNLVLVGEIDDEKEQSFALKEVSFSDILSTQRELLEGVQLREQKRMEAFKERGLHYIPRHMDEMTTFRLGEDQFN